MKNIKIIGFVVLIAVLGWFGYVAYQDANKVEVIRFSGVDVSSVSFIFKLMNDKGIAAKHKIQVDIVNSSPAEAERKIVERVDGVEAGVFNPLSMIQANQAKKVHLQAFAPFYNTYHTILVRSDSSYKTIEDLKGARFAIRPKASAAYNALASAMKANGLDLNNDFKLVFTDIPGSAKALTGGEVDATSLNIELTARLVASGQFRILVDLNEKWQTFAGAEMPFINIAAHADWIAQNPRKVQRLRNAILETAKYIRNNTQIINEYKDYLKYTTEIEEKILKEKMPYLYPIVWDIPANKLFIQKAAELGLLKLPSEELFVE